MIIATSNHPPDGLLPNPLYRDHFLPGIALVRHLHGRPRSRFETGEIPRTRNSRDTRRPAA